MNNSPITPISAFDPVYRVDTTDRVLGGELGAINIQAQQLANRDEYLHGLLQGFSANLNVNGYQKFPGGLTMQWGQISATKDSTVSVLFPVEFTTTCFHIFPSVVYDGNDPAGEIPHVKTQSTTGATIYNPKNWTVTVCYLAIGY